MKVITILNSKGGTGKTTLATHLAAGLAYSHRVLLIDGDSQGNASTAMRLDKRPDFYDLCVRGSDWANVMRSVDRDVYAFEGDALDGVLLMTTGNHETGSLASNMKQSSIIRTRFKELEGVLDYIIVDTSPTPSLIHDAILFATDCVIVPTDCEAFGALHGLPSTIEGSMEMRMQMRDYNVDGAQVIGIVPSRRYRNLILHNQMVAQVKAKYDNLVWPSLYQYSVVGEAQAARQMVYTYAPEHQITTRFWDMVGYVEAWSHVAK